MEKKLKVKLSNFKTTLTFNEWCEKYNVGSHYVEPTKYFTGHLGSTMNTRYEFLPEVSQGEGKFTGILKKLKTKIKWVEKIV
jgi:hypothetical protein